MEITYYEGGGIYFRPLEAADEPLLRRWINDPANWSTLARCRPVNEAGEREFIEGLYKSPEEVALGIVVRQEERLIGLAGLHRISPINHSAVFGLLIGEGRYQSCGFGTEATRLMVRYGFEELNLHRISLSVFASNERGIRAYRRAGFVQEGCRRQAFYRNGRYHDELCFGILRSEWEEQVRQDEAQHDDDLPLVQLAAMTMWDTRISG